MSSILYYSNFCQHSKSLIQNVGRSPEISKDVHFICIDKRMKKEDGKTYIILENGQQIVMPDNISKVPALLLLNDNYRVVYGEEIANFCGVSVSTLKRNFDPPIKRGWDKGKRSLRRAMFDKAMRGNTTMLIWLSKNYLGIKHTYVHTNQENFLENLTQQVKSHDCPISTISY